MLEPGAPGKAVVATAVLVASEITETVPEP